MPEAVDVEQAANRKRPPRASSPQARARALGGERGAPVITAVALAVAVVTFALIAVVHTTAGSGSG